MDNFEIVLRTHTSTVIVLRVQQSSDTYALHRSRNSAMSVALLGRFVDSYITVLCPAHTPVEALSVLATGLETCHRPTSSTSRHRVTLHPGQ